jgi:hypothetical protein
VLTGCCEDVNQPSGSIKGGKYFNQLRLSSSLGGLCYIVKPSKMAAVALFWLLCLDNREKADEYFMIQSVACAVHFSVPSDCKDHYE